MTKHLKVKHLGREKCYRDLCDCPDHVSPQADHLDAFGCFPKTPHSPQVEECEPTIVDLNDPMFNVVWSAIKKWDISRSQNMEGRRMYAGATGTDVMTILNVVRPFLLQARADERREMVEKALGIVLNHSTPSNEQMNIVRALRKLEANLIKEK